MTGESPSLSCTPSREICVSITSGTQKPGRNPSSTVIYPYSAMQLAAPGTQHSHPLHPSRSLRTHQLYVETYRSSVCTHPVRHQYCCRYYAGLRIPVPDGTFPKQYPCYGRPHRFLADQLFFKHTRAAPRALADMELLPCKADLGDRRSD